MNNALQNNRFYQLISKNQEIFEQLSKITTDEQIFPIVHPSLKNYTKADLAVELSSIQDLTMKNGEISLEELEEIAGGLFEFNTRSGKLALALSSALALAGIASVANHHPSGDSPLDTIVSSITNILPSETASAWAIQEHQDISTNAYEQLAKNGITNLHVKAKQSLEKGAVLNDMYNNNFASFGVKYATKTDEFINQSHHGSMQFLHMMQSGESLETTIQKSLTWIQICLDVYQNNQNIANTTLLDYTLAADNTVKEMLTRLLVKHSYLDNHPQLSTTQLLEQLQNNPKVRSSYAKLTFQKFFQVNSNVDYRFVALGSAMHVIEDRFANSHAQNSMSAAPGKLQKQQAMLSGAINAETLNEVISPIMLTANYSVQNASLHEKADNFVDSVKYVKIIQTKKATSNKARVEWKRCFFLRCTFCNLLLVDKIQLPSSNL